MKGRSENAARSEKRPASGPDREKEERIQRLYRKGWNPRRVLAGYFSVYVTEGMVRSIMVLLPIYLASGIFKLDAVQTGFILIMAYVPWHFKFLIGLGMDVTPTIGTWRRRTYIVLGTFVTIMGVMWLSNTADPWMGILPAIIMVMAGDALIDTGIDSLLLDVAPPDWHGVGMGVGWGARAIGVAISSVITFFVQATWGFTAAFYIFVLYAIPALLAVEIHEPKLTGERRISKKPLAETFTDKKIIGWVGFALLGCFVYVLDPTRGILSLIATSIAGPQSSVIFYVTICFALASALASFIMCRPLDRMGHRRGYYISLAGAFLSILLWCTLGQGMLAWLLVCSGILGFFVAFNFVAWATVLADTVPPHFTAFMWQYDMGWLHVAAFMSGIFITYMLGAGYQAALIGMALLTLLGFIPAKFIRSMRLSKGEIS